MDTLVWPIWVLLAWIAFRLVGEVVCRGQAKAWFGVPEPGAMRLFGRGRVRPMQSFESLRTPNLEQATDAFQKKSLIRDNVIKRQSDWAALADGIVVGACASAAVVAASTRSHDALAAMPQAADHINVGAASLDKMSTAQHMGYTNWLQGEIGDSVAANVLTQQGHHVVFAESQNQPGWDLMVDGVRTQVKVGETAGANIAEHFERYPGIPVVTDPQTAALLDHPLVHGLQGLEPERVQELAANRLQALADGGNQVGAVSDASGNIAPTGGNQWDPAGSANDSIAQQGSGLPQLDGIDATPSIPWITIGVTAAREAQLAKKYGGNAVESVVAVGTDAAAIAVGAQIGGVAGSFLGPIGAFVGAVGGGMFARGLVNSGRQSEVQREIAALRPKRDDFNLKLNEAVSAFASDANECVARRNRAIKTEFAPTFNSYRETIRKLSRRHDDEAYNFCKRVHTAFDQFDEALAEDVRDVRSRFPSRSKISAFLLPSMGDHVSAIVAEWAEDKQKELDGWRHRFGAVVAEAELSGKSNAGRARDLLEEFAAKYKLWDESAASLIQQTLTAFDRISSEATSEHKRAMGTGARLLEKAEAEVRKELDFLWSGQERELRKLAQSIDHEFRDVARRARRANVHYPSPVELVDDLSGQLKKGIAYQTSGADRIRKLPALKSATV